MPMPIVKALSVMSASPGGNATAVREARSRCERNALTPPERVKVPMGQPIEMTMPRKLITTGDTRCTTSSNRGRNKVTEVCVMPCNDKIHSVSPIGACFCGVLGFVRNASFRKIIYRRQVTGSLMRGVSGPCGA